MRRRERRDCVRRVRDGILGAGILRLIAYQDGWYTMATEIIAQVEREVMDFLLQGPSLQDIAAFQVSSALSERLDELLDANRELTRAEREEFEQYMYFEHFMRMLKIAAHRRLDQQTS